MGHGNRRGQQKHPTRDSRIRGAAEEPRGGVLTGKAPRWGGRSLGEAAGGVPRRRGVGLATPGFCWPVCPKKVPKEVVGVVWFVCSGYGVCSNVSSWGFCRCEGRGCSGRRGRYGCRSRHNRRGRCDC